MTRSKHSLTETQSSNTDSLPPQVNNQTKHACFPDTVRFAPFVGVKSFKTMANGWRLFVLAKNLVTDGNDHVDRDLVVAFCKSLGLKPLTLHRMMDSARGLGFITPIQRRDGHWDLILMSNKKFNQEVAGIDHERTVWIDPKLLVGDGWKARVFASWEATFNGRLISRKKMEELSGIKEVTQRMYDRQAGVERISNYAVSNIHANGFDGVFEYGNRACVFKYWDKNTHQLKIGWRLPDCRMFPQARTNGSHKTLRALSLFNETEEQYKRSLKTIVKHDELHSMNELYLFSHVSKNGNRMWIHSVL